MRHLTYLVALLVPLAAMVAVDLRLRLVLWADRRRGAVVLAVAVAAFLGWDLLALHEGFYHRGGTPFMTDVDLVPGLPLEEVLFVVFFCYLSLVVNRLVHRLLARTPARSPKGEEVTVR
jgi:lycopene cyclase domain-containing protein